MGYGVRRQNDKGKLLGRTVRLEQPSMNLVKICEFIERLSIVSWRSLVKRLGTIFLVQNYRILWTGY